MIGKTISHYTILEKLGEGGMGVVYKAEDAKLRRTVTLKFLAPEAIGSQKERERFVQEAQMAASLDHPNICTIFGIDQVKEQTFFSMAYVDGLSVKDKLTHGPMQLDEAIDIVIQAARGLRAAHNRGIIHRDISSSNIMVTNDDQVKIMDFGLAKLSGRAKVKQSGETGGTAAYMAPEQARGEPVDSRSDVYSLGVVLYELITGQVPFPEEQRAAVLYQIMNQDPEPLSRFRADLPKELQLIIDRALHKNVEQRYQSAGDMRADLKALVRKLGIERSGVYSTFSFAKKQYFKATQKILIGLGVIVLLLLFVPRDRRVQQGSLYSGMLPAEKHIVLLPLANSGAGPVNQKLCEGLIESLTAKLARLEKYDASLRVVPAREVNERRLTAVPAARQQLGITLGVTGTVECSAERFKISLWIVDANTLKQLRSMLIDNRREDMLMLQDDAILDLAEILQINMNTEAMAAVTAGGTNVPSAFETYLQGRGYLLHAAASNDIDGAIALFEGAIAQDSLYALAHLGLGEACARKYEFTHDLDLLLMAESCRARASGLDSLLNTSPLDELLARLTGSTPVGAPGDTQ
jgi:TolB-like protein